MLTVFAILGLIGWIAFQTLRQQAALDAAEARGRGKRPEALIFGEGPFSARVIWEGPSGEEVQAVFGPVREAADARDLVLSKFPDAILSFASADLGSGGQRFRPKFGHRREYVT